MKKQLKRFIVVGSATVAIDYFIYLFLVSRYGQYFYFKGISFTVGATFSYICNSLFSFEQGRLSKRQLVKFILTYVFSLLCNVHVNRLMLSLPWHSFEHISLYVSFVVATFTSTMLNFTLMASYVFSKK